MSASSSVSGNENAGSNASNDEIVAQITINAPARRVFDALTDPRQRIQWWGAEGRFKATEMESDLRPGGAWMMRGSSQGPQGERPFVARGEYRAIDPPRLLEFTWIADWHPPTAPVTVVRFDLEEHAGVTTVRLTHSGFAGDASREAYKGWPWLLSMLRTFAEKNRT